MREMKFKYSTIGDNTQENREWLEKLGYKVNHSSDDRFLRTYEDGSTKISHFKNWIYEDKQPINCIGNSSLFKAVSAMREDSDCYIESGELWVFIDGYPNYQVSHKGNIRSLNYARTGVIKNMSPAPNKQGYPICVLRNGLVKRTVCVHRVVANTFIPNPSNFKQVNHINGDKSNNCISNLEWCDQSYNMNHAYENNLNPRQKAVIQKDISGKLLNTYRSAHEASRCTGVNRGNISSCCIGNISQAGGFTWEYTTLTELQEKFKL